MTPQVRCAVYARFSSDLQRPASIEDQVRRCRDFAASQHWEVIEDYVRFDEAKSAASLAGRDALNSLLADAKRKPPPFDCLLVDDTSRLARYLPDVLSLNDRLRYDGIFIYAVAQRLDCREKGSRPLLTLHGTMDEQFLVSLAEKVHRGQEGRALKGLQPGGKCFGYRNIPIEDPTRSGKYGRFAVSGVRLEIDEEQAAIVRRVFEMYAGGDSLSTIAKTLNAEGVQAPQPPRDEGHSGLVSVVDPRDASKRAVSWGLRLESDQERAESGDGPENQSPTAGVGMEAGRGPGVAYCQR
jgi:DNA invertase Pin-like site-specific DNA recombinase